MKELHEYQLELADLYKKLYEMNFFNFLKRIKIIKKIHLLEKEYSKHYPEKQM